MLGSAPLRADVAGDDSIQAGRRERPPGALRPRREFNQQCVEDQVQPNIGLIALGENYRFSIGQLQGLLNGVPRSRFVRSNAVPYPFL